MKGENLHTKEIFDKDYSGRNWEWYKDLLAKCIKFGSPGKILDLGAGLGFFVECATRFGIDCIGLEGSEYAVAETKKRFQLIDMRQHFLEDNIPFEKETFSIVLCYQVIEHLKPQVAKFVLKESFRVLRKGGSLFVYSPCLYNKNEKIDKNHINLYTPNSLKNELSEVGFNRIKALNNPRLFFGKSKFELFLMGKLFKIFPWDFLSSTANFVAYK